MRLQEITHLLLELISTQHPYCSPLSFRKVQEREGLSLPSLFLYLSLSFQASLMGPPCSAETRFLKVANLFPKSRLSVSCLTFILLSLLMTFDELAKSYVSKFHAFTLSGQSSSQLSNCSISFSLPISLQRWFLHP